MSKGKVPEGLDPVVSIDGVDRYRPSMAEVRGLAWNLGGMVARSSFDIKYLVAVTRGGLVVTDCASRALGIKDIQTLAIEGYDESQSEGVNLEKVRDNFIVYRTPKLPRQGRGAVFFDDVLDTGKTAGFIRGKWPKAAIAAVYSKHHHEDTLEMAHFYGRYVGDIWVDFPWEVETQTRAQLQTDEPGIVF